MSGARPIFLVGMMGAGKSTIGPLLAKALSRPFVDTDAEVERETGRTIAEIFARDGETAFRRLEREAIERASREAAVIALGGGAPVQPGALAWLRARGILVYLRASADVLLERIGEPSSRPLLSGLGPAERRARLEALLASRETCYGQADHVVDAEVGEESVVDEILAALDPKAGRARDRGGEARPRRARSASGGETSNKESVGSMGTRRSAKTSTKRTARRSGGGSGRRSVSSAGAGGPQAVVPVELGERSYPIEIGEDWLETIGRRIGERLAVERVALVTVSTVARRYAPRLTRGLSAAGVRARRVLVPDGDAHKSLRQLARLYEAFLDQGLDRHSAVVTLGGGVVGDLGGFAAATFLRGIPFVQVPTTVLAMVDASIGGKTGVNLARGKNLVGAFHQPSGVFIDIATLRSLPRRERAAGAAELIKAAAIWDATLFEWLEERIEAFLDLEPESVIPALERACAIKAEVVARDEREGGLRRLLNFGHTLAHAIESHARYRGILHGEAVAIGMVFAAQRSEELGFSPAGTADRLEALLARAGLPTRPPDRPRRAYLEAIAVDKKKQGDRIHFVVLEGIGRAKTASLQPRDILPPGWKA